MHRRGAAGRRVVHEVGRAIRIFNAAASIERAGTWIIRLFALFPRLGVIKRRADQIVVVSPGDVATQLNW